MGEAFSSGGMLTLSITASTPDTPRCWALSRRSNATPRRWVQSYKRTLRSRVPPGSTRVVYKGISSRSYTHVCGGRSRSAWRQSASIASSMARQLKTTPKLISCLSRLSRNPN
jgi:hypothetical protein